MLSPCKILSMHLKEESHCSLKDQLICNWKACPLGWCFSDDIKFDVSDLLDSAYMAMDGGWEAVFCLF